MGIQSERDQISQHKRIPRSKSDISPGFSKHLVKVPYISSLQHINFTSENKTGITP